MSKPFDQKNQETYNYIFYHENVLRSDFRKADLNKDGFVQFPEFKRLYLSYGYPIGDEDLQKAFDEQDTNKDGKISVDEYINYYKSCNEQSKLIKEYTQMFESIDTNNNGFISSSELKDHWKSNGIDLNDKTIKQIISYFDLDNDRQINLDEYLDILTFKHLKLKGHELDEKAFLKNQETYYYINYYEERLRDDFRKADLDKSGFISFDEFKKLLNQYGYPISDEDLKKTFDEEDTDKDGKISADEYVAYIKKVNSQKTLIEQYTEMFKKIDTDGDGLIDNKELLAHWKASGINLSDEWVQKIIAYFDLNADHAINLDEYLDILTFKHLIVNHN